MFLDLTGSAFQRRGHDGYFILV